ncbi:MAG: hypothetical protein JWM86_2 [Thermoleophilia bacterium]|nr:hypothetical protein [Thermoleophilia bacterium]
MRRTFPISATILLAAILVSACGGGSDEGDSGTPNLGRSKTEGYLAQDIADKLEVPVRVACPKRLPKRKGASFTCLAFAPLSLPIPAVAKVRDTKGTFTWHMDARATDDIETQIQKGIRTQKKLVATIVCPRLIELDQGAAFTCTAVRASGVRSDVVVTQVDAKGNVTWSA